MEKLNLKYDTNILSNGDRTIRIRYDEYAESPRDLDEGNLVLCQENGQVK